MWLKRRRDMTDWSGAVARLRGDGALGPVVRRVGACTLGPRGDYFVSLAQAIYSQQLSGKIAALLFGRYRGLFPGRRPTAARTLKLSDGQLRSSGLSRQKMAYLRDLARHFEAGKIPMRRLAAMTDEEIIAALTAVHGIGRWTAEMFLIFNLNRPDVFPVDDLGVRKGVQRVFGLAEVPGAKACVAYGEGWRPWRTVATWYLWRSGQ